MKIQMPALGLLVVLSFGPVNAADAQVAYCQRSYPWAPYKVGFGPGTIRDLGCALTCIASLETWRGWGVNPLSLNSWGKAHGGFYGNLVVWGAYPGFREIRNYDYVAADLGWINRQLDTGKLVVVKTFMNHNYNWGHWVLLYGHSRNVYFMMDPWWGSTNVTFNARYGDPGRWIYKAVTYAR